MRVHTRPVKGDIQSFLGCAYHDNQPTVICECNQKWWGGKHMFDYAYNNNYTIDEEKKQDTNEINLFLDVGLQYMCYNWINKKQGYCLLCYSLVTTT